MKGKGLKAAALLALLAAPVAVFGQTVQINLAPGEVLLKVTAEGTDRSRPDLMSLTAGVVTTGRTARQALAANNQLANRLIDAVRAQGVAAADVRTKELTVRPQFARRDENRTDDDPPSSTIIGYVATNSLALTLRELTKGPGLIDALFGAGANKVEGPSFALSDPGPARKRAREAAVAAALDEATAYADALQMKIGRVLQLSERGDFVVGESLNELPALRSNFARPTPVEPGDLTTRITVWIDYALVPGR